MKTIENIKKFTLTYEFMVETIQLVNYGNSRIMKTTAHNINEAMMKVLAAADADGLTVVNIDFLRAKNVK